MRLQALIDKLLPKDEKFFALLERQATVLGQAAEEMASFSLVASSTAAALVRIHDIEHQGDEIVRQVTRALDDTFVTPIDREDIYNLACSIDNVLDNFYAAAQAFVAYEVKTVTPAMRQLLGLCAAAAVLLKDAVPLMQRRLIEQLAPARHQIVALEKRGDSIYQHEMAALYNDPALPPKDLMRQQAVLSAMEAALDSCQDAADVLENVAIKHS